MFCEKKDGANADAKTAYCEHKLLFGHKIQYLCIVFYKLLDPFLKDDEGQAI